jgi:hypothetical protein
MKTIKQISEKLKMSEGETVNLLVALFNKHYFTCFSCGETKEFFHHIGVNGISNKKCTSCCKRTTSGDYVLLQTGKIAKVSASFKDTVNIQYCNDFGVVPSCQSITKVNKKSVIFSDNNFDFVNRKKRELENEH